MSFRLLNEIRSDFRENFFEAASNFLKIDSIRLNTDWLNLEWSRSLYFGGDWNKSSAGRWHFWGVACILSEIDLILFRIELSCCLELWREREISSNCEVTFSNSSRKSRFRSYNFWLADRAADSWALISALKQSRFHKYEIL